MIKLDQMFDIIIIDTGAGISDSVMAFLQVATKVLLVTTGDPTSITDAYALLKVFKNAMGENKPDIKVIVNMVTSREKAEGTFLKLNQVCEKFLNMNIEVIEYLPNDVSLGKAVMMQKPVSILFPKSDIGLAFSRLANKVDEEIAYSKIEKLEDLKNSIEEKMQRDSKRGLFSLIHHMLRKKEDL